jgi:hypothetical protein
MTMSERPESPPLPLQLAKEDVARVAGNALVEVEAEPPALSSSV